MVRDGFDTPLNRVDQRRAADYATETMLHLAIETSGATGDVALGRDDALLECRALTQERRHNLELLPTIDALLRDHGHRPADLDAVFVSTGPGSFTGIRAGVTAAKTIARFTDAALVPVSTLDALAWRLREYDTAQHAAVVLNVKHASAWCGVYRNGQHKPVIAPAVRTLDELATACGAEGVTIDALIGDPLPTMPDVWAALPQYTGDAATVRADAVWALGVRALRDGQMTDPMTLAPCYAREPEAVTLWNQRYGQRR